jgi:hypothetical protein
MLQALHTHTYIYIHIHTHTTYTVIHCHLDTKKPLKIKNTLAYYFLVIDPFLRGLFNTPCGFKGALGQPCRN